MQVAESEVAVSESSDENVLDLPQEEKDSIEKAVEDSFIESKADDEDKESEPDGDDPKDEDSSTVEEDDNEVSSEDDKLDDDDDSVSDDMLEKAISLGVPIAEARKLGSDLLQRRIDNLESKVIDQDEIKPEDRSPSKDLFEGIPDLDPDVYDEELVNAFSGLKQIIRDQSAALESISKASQNESLVGKLEGDAAEALKANPSKEADLIEKVNILKAGYKSVGKEVSQADVMAEAVSSVLGSEIEKVAASKKAAKAEKRGGQKISRSNGGRNVESKDVFDEIGEALDRKYFDKK